MIPYVVSTFSTVGKESLYLPASLAHNISESGTCFAIALRTKDTKLRAVALSAGISALFGITEPALYGVTLQHKRALISVITGGVIGGAYVGIAGLSGFTIVGPGLASLPMFVDKSNPDNLIHALIGFGISFVVSFVVSLIIWKNDEETSSASDTGEKATTVVAEDLMAPVAGKVLPLADVPDDVFSQGLIGQGIAVEPSDGKLIAPTDGTIEMVYETKHALGMRTDNGAELLFHIGLDTVQLNGKYFESLVQVGQHVQAGELLETFDVAKIKAAGYNPITMMVVTNQDSYTIAVDEKNETLDSRSVMNIAKLGV